MSAVETNEGFPWKEKKKVTKQPHFAIPFTSPVDVEQYNYALIYGIVALSMRESPSIQKEDFSSSTSPPTLSPSPFLSFSSFIYLNVNYICVGCHQCRLWCIHF